MTRQEWQARSQYWEDKAHKFYDQGDISMGEICEAKADASRAMADYARDEEDKP
jgi:hypothetical protein